ncbi:hypothetical protein G9O61_00g018190 [Vairimorpha ceranae]|nr:hypothetical protein G9O61_00g018190 [Vairimorpha ceranae]
MLFFNKLVKSNTPVLISLRNNHKIVGRIMKYDKHFNLIVHDATIYKKMKSRNRGIKKRLEGYQCYTSLNDKEMYIRGDMIIFINEIE